MHVKCGNAIEWSIRVPVTSRQERIALGWRAGGLKDEVKLDVSSSASRM